jgi:sulfoxide reductase heme-binding subunit YedZ
LLAFYALRAAVTPGVFPRLTCRRQSPYRSLKEISLVPLILPWRDRRGRFLPLKAIALTGAVVPAALLAWQWWAGELGGRPITEVIHGTGLWAVRWLLITLAITPLGRMFSSTPLLQTRRIAGVTAACYAAVHLCLYALDQKWQLGVVVSEIAKRFYLTVGLVALSGLVALAATSFDGAMRRMGRWWKRLHRLAYPVAALAIFHYFIQAKANVSEPVFVAGLFLWLMAWRALPTSWQRAWVTYPVLALLVGFATAWIEFVWYGLATRINPWRVLDANETLRFGLRPAHWVVVVALCVAVALIVRRVPLRSWPRVLPASG